MTRLEAFALSAAFPVLLAGCLSKSPHAATAPPATGAVPSPSGAAAPNACVAACVHRNQMRAVSIEQIEADCAGECGPPPDEK